MHRVSERWTAENLRKGIKENNSVELKVEPMLMKEHPNSNTLLQCFGRAEHYLKCDRGALLQYK